MGKFYITTAIPYTNAAPHIGFAMELVQADVLARYHRELGDATFFLTGTDEHGSKNFKTAQKAGILPQELADQNTTRFIDLTQALHISNDDFIRTTSERHKNGAQKLWSMIADSGDLYKSEYEGLYCVGCEAFITEKELVEGKCPEHNEPPEKLKEDNYFFALSKYSEKIGRLIETDELLIFPQSRKKEILQIIKNGLRDVSFSRPNKSLPWGVGVPDSEDQTMYVWCDALSNYITALGFADESEKYKTFWPADVHLIGKGILRFHAGIWIGMLLSAKLPLPKAIYVHGYVTSEGQKMSKSLGNVVDPFEIADEYGTDATRYYLMREIPTTDDGDFSKNRFEAVYDSELANSMGNLLSRVLTLVEKHGEKLEPNEMADFADDIQNEWKMYHAGMNEFDLKACMEAAMRVATIGDRYVDAEKPWEMKDAKKRGEILSDLLFLLSELQKMISPVMPESAKKMKEQIAARKKGSPLFPRRN